MGGMSLFYSQLVHYFSRKKSVLGCVIKCKVIMLYVLHNIISNLCSYVLVIFNLHIHG